MKKLIFLVAFPFVSFANQNLERDVQILGQDVRQELGSIGQEEGILRHLIAKRRLRSLMKRHADKKNNKYVEMVEQMLKDPAPMPSDVLRDLLVKVFGEDVADILIQLSALPDVEKRLKGLLFDWKLLLNKQDCPEGVKLVAGNLAFLAATSAIAIYAPPPFQYLAVQGGSIAGDAVELLVELTRANTALCDLVYKEQYGRLGYSS